MNDTPKMWNSNEAALLNDDTEYNEIMVSEEEAHFEVPSVIEQKQALEKSDLHGVSYDMVDSLIESYKISQLLKQIGSSETEEDRKNVLKSLCEAFINARMRNNMTAENLKSKLLVRLLQNIDRLDLATVAQIYIDLTQTMAVDSQMAMATLNGGTPGTTSGNGTTVNLNLATGENGMVTAQTLNATPQQVGQLKEVTAMNSSLKAWSNVQQLPRKKPTVSESE